ncbi:hypothetical protein [Methyloceanibacter sp.]|uniref:hypothetical protein n=1 Tax=Methyloceanibacter sp. TaxID=1965321 RepID=UPI003D6D75BA
MGRRDGNPIWLSAGESRGEKLNRLDLRSGLPGTYDEAWLQALLDTHPEVLPIEQIEPGFGTPISLCRELPLDFGGGSSGALDNLFATQAGGLVLVETKLWRNPEARRTVVAQAMEYAAAVFRLSYEELETAVKSARKAAGESEQSVAALVAANANADFDEVTFIDAVSRNLWRGRAIVAVVGDGIREDITLLAELLQSHAGHRFVFSLIELGVYETPVSGARLIYPSVLGQTTLIERGVVQIDDGGMNGGPRIVVVPPVATSVSTGRARRITLGEDEFYELLDEREPGMAAHLKEFLARAAPHGINPEMKGGMNLKHASPNGQSLLNLGAIDRWGLVDTGPATWWDRSEPGKAYNEALAKLIGGIVKELGGGNSAVRTAFGKMPRLSDFLPRHGDAWLDAIDEYTATIASDDQG